MKQRSYWEFVNLGFANWFLFGARDIPLRGRIALTGPNGCGKSSILDAIQTVLTGRSGRHLQLNSLVQTDRAGRRTVRDYCLGAIDDADEGHAYARQQAISYLLLGFRRTTDGKEVTIGLCMTARVDTPEENVEARFILEGRVLTSVDVTESGVDQNGKWSTALPWKEVSARLNAEPGVSLTTYTGPELFVRQVCRVVGPENGSVDPQKFLRNLKNAMAFKPVGNTTEFVRSYILDAQPMNLRDLRASIARFREIRLKIAEIKSRIADAADLVARGDRIRARQRTLVLHRLNAMQGRIHLAASARLSAIADTETTSRALSEAAASIPGLEEKAAVLGRAEAEAKAELAGSAATLAVERLDARLELIEERERSVRLRLEPVEQLIRDMGELAPLVAPFSATTAKKLAGIGKSGDDPIPELLALCRSRLPRDLESAGEAVERETDAVRSEASFLRARLTEIEGLLGQAGPGGSPVSEQTRQLSDALSAAGIKSFPLCSLVEAVDPVWRNAVEAILGEGREALITDPADHGAALKIFRSMGNLGAQIVNTTKTKGTRAARSGTLATVLKSGNVHARAFLDYRLGHIVMVHDETGLAKEESAATPDLMYASGRTVRRLRTPYRLLLGTGVQDARDALRGELEEVRQSIAVCATRSDQLRAVRRAVEKLTAGIRAVDPDAVSVLLGEVEAIEHECVENRREAALLSSGRDDGGMQERIARLSADLAEVSGKLRRAVEKKATLGERLAAKEAAVHLRRDEELRLRTAAESLITESAVLIGPDEEAAAEFWLSQDVPEPPTPGRAQAGDDDGEVSGKPKDNSLSARLDYLEGYVITYHVERLDRDRPGLVIRIGSYVTNYGVDRPSFIDDDTLSTEGRYLAAVGWARREEENLSGQVLKDYEDKARIAYEEAVRHFQGDFVGKMRGAFEAISGRLREINRQLAKRDFHGLNYRFDRKDAAGYKDMIALIEASGQLDLDGEMTDGPAGDRVSRALKVLEDIALDPEASIESLEDPRQYFEFDILMDKDGIERTTMSKRLGTGSGGQVQVPYYIAICAALAATAYPDRSSLDGGIPLAIFDEAFNRMDTAVIGEVMEFISDVGLQPLIAAPDKERGTFLQFADTIISLSRSGFAVDLDVQYVKEHAHQRFRTENPALAGFEVFSGNPKLIPILEPLSE